MIGRTRNDVARPPEHLPLTFLGQQARERPGRRIKREPIEFVFERGSRGVSWNTDLACRLGDDMIYGVTHRRDITSDEGESHLLQSAIAVPFRLEDLDRNFLTGGI